MVDGVTLGPTSFLIGEGPELMNYPTTELFTPVQFLSRLLFWVTKLVNIRAIPFVVFRVLFAVRPYIAPRDCSWVYAHAFSQDRYCGLR